MTAPSDLAALALRVEQEEPSRELWEEVWHAVSSRPLPDDAQTHIRFWTLCAMDAWRDAAAMLTPPGWLIFDIEQNEPDHCRVTLAADDAQGRPRHRMADGEATGPHAEARARCAAALCAHAGAR